MAVGDAAFGKAIAGQMKSMAQFYASAQIEVARKWLETEMNAAMSAPAAASQLAAK